MGRHRDVDMLEGKKLKKLRVRHDEGPSTTSHSSQQFTFPALPLPVEAAVEGELVHPMGLADLNAHTASLIFCTSPRLHSPTSSRLRSRTAKKNKTSRRPVARQLATETSSGADFFEPQQLLCETVGGTPAKNRDKNALFSLQDPDAHSCIHSRASRPFNPFSLPHSAAHLSPTPNHRPSDTTTTASRLSAKFSRHPPCQLCQGCVKSGNSIGCTWHASTPRKASTHVQPGGFSVEEGSNTRRRAAVPAVTAPATLSQERVRGEFSNYKCEGEDGEGEDTTVTYFPLWSNSPKQIPNSNVSRLSSSRKPPQQLVNSTRAASCADHPAQSALSLSSSPNATSASSLLGPRACVAWLSLDGVLRMSAADVASAACAWQVTEAALTHADVLTWTNTPPFYVSTKRAPISKHLMGLTQISH